MMVRPFLKWPGGKYRLLERIQRLLPQGKQLIEPFVGGGAVFLNTSFEHYILNDANPDLISLYQVLQKEGRHFIEICRSFFIKRYNTEKQYYKHRAKFNACPDPVLRSALFLYLNRHGYNGLCRYNAGKGEFNVPFGSYIKPYFPEKEMLHFHEIAKRAVFVCKDFSEIFKKAKKGNVIYCDPPYVPLTETANFTRYQSRGFSLEEQQTLASLAKKCAQKGIPVLLSNHSNDFTRDIYAEAMVEEFDVRRLISCKPACRQPVLELLALYI